MAEAIGLGSTDHDSTVEKTLQKIYFLAFTLVLVKITEFTRQAAVLFSVDLGMTNYSQYSHLSKNIDAIYQYFKLRKCYMMLLVSISYWEVSGCIFWHPVSHYRVIDLLYGADSWPAQDMSRGMAPLYRCSVISVINCVIPGWALKQPSFVKLFWSL